MQGENRYSITLTSSAPGQLPKVRIVYRADDAAAIDAAERELRRHRNVWGANAVFDGWRLRMSTKDNFKGRLIAEVRPGYDSRTVDHDSDNNSDVPPF